MVKLTLKEINKVKDFLLLPHYHKLKGIGLGDRAITILTTEWDYFLCSKVQDCFLMNEKAKLPPRAKGVGYSCSSGGQSIEPIRIILKL
jgi:hypothetical protein